MPPSPPTLALRVQCWMVTLRYARPTTAGKECTLSERLALVHETCPTISQQLHGAYDEAPPRGFVYGGDAGGLKTTLGMRTYLTTEHAESTDAEFLGPHAERCFE